MHFMLAVEGHFSVNVSVWLYITYAQKVVDVLNPLLYEVFHKVILLYSYGVQWTFIIVYN